MIDNADDHVWLTYDEAAQTLGIKADSVRRRAAARRWPKRPNNDRTVRVGIPRDAIPDHIPAAIHDVTPDVTDTLRADLAASKAEITGLRDRLTDTQAERDRLAHLLEKALESRLGILSRLFRR